MNKTVFLLLAFFPLLASAAAPPREDKYISRCEITPAVVPADRYPGRAAIVPSNKLALPAGKSILAKGQLVYITGRVFDENCVPVSDAIVDIWQANPQGKYVYASLKERMDPYPGFAGSGRAVTDNLGRYRFLTLFPGVEGPRHAPHVHVHVIHKDFDTLDTEMFFAGDSRNDDDNKLTRMPEGTRSLVMAKIWPRNPKDPSKGLNAEWDITLRGRNAFRHF